VSTLPSGEIGLDDISRFQRFVQLTSKQLKSEHLIDHSSLTEDEQYELDRVKGAELPGSIDSIRVLFSEEEDAGQQHKRLYVAAGNGGITRLNFDDQNGMQVIDSVLPTKLVRDIEKVGYSLFASTASDVDVDLQPGPCSFIEGASINTDLSSYSYIESTDPIHVPSVDGLTGGDLLYYHKGLLFNGTQSFGNLWGACHPNWRQQTAEPLMNSDSDTINVVNVFDPLLTQSYNFDSTVFDITSYGDYIITALGNKGIEIFHQDRPTVRTRVDLNTLQEQNSSAHRIKLAGNLLFVAAMNSGVIVLDLSDVMTPRVISAGNDENINSLDIYRDRLIAGAGDEGLRTLQLPSAIVLSTSVNEGDYLAANEPYRVMFNESIAVDSVLADDVVQVTRLDNNNSVSVVINALDVSDSSAREFELSFEREAGITYRIDINNVRNLRGTGQWAPFTQTFIQANLDAVRPHISGIENNIFHRGSQQSIVLHGEHFRPEMDLLVDAYPVAINWIDENTIEIPSSGLDMLPLSVGQHHIQLQDGELVLRYPGAILIGDELTDVEFSLSRDSVDTQGEYDVSINASKSVILPGSKVIMRPASGNEIRSEVNELGFDITDLRDDVKNLNTFTFRVPGVITPELYNVYLTIAGTELLVGSMSYTLADGLTIELPNYPPQQLGATVITDNILFAGVKSGEEPTAENRFLMPSGLEIYDISIWEQPIRISQLVTDEPVTGIEIVDNLAFLANGKKGLSIVNITDLANPLLVNSHPVPSHIATDVAYNAKAQVLAMSVSDELGTGFIRFYNVADDQLNPPVSYSNLVFNEGELRGQPVDIQWLNDELYVLLKRDEQLYLVIFNNLSDTATYQVHMIERGVVDDINNASLFVEHGQITVTTSTELLVIQPNVEGEYKTIYWNELNTSGAEVFNNQGSAFVSTTNGIGDVTSPSLVISSVSPVNGAELSVHDTIRIQFNDLINTDEDIIASAVSLNQENGSVLDNSFYSITATNHLSGAYIDISFTGDMSYLGELTVTVSTEVTSLSATPLLSPLTLNYTLLDGIRPSINAVNRVVDSALVQPFFHANGTETIRISGSGFGDNLAELAISIGETPLQNSEVTQLSDTSLEFVMPNLFLANNVISLPISITRDELSVIKQGAIVILPPIDIDDIKPISGPPQGGNLVDLFGSGFNHSTRVTFAGVQAGDLKVINSGHIQVRAPSGSFGYAQVAAVNNQFEDEEIVSPIDYFYADKETGSVDLTTDKPSPVSAVFLDDQVLYAVTGGHYDVIGEQSGRIEKVLRSNVARLVVANVADPVRPIIIEKEFAEAFLPYHLDVTGGLSPEGFAGIAGSGNNLFALGGKGLYHFDITLPAEPVLLHTLALNGTARDIAIDGDIVYISDSVGIHIYEITQQRNLRQIKTISSIELKGTTNKLYLEGNSLWASMSNARRVVEIELMSGAYSIVRDIPINTLAEKRIRPRDLLVKNNLLFVSSGNLGTVELFSLNDESATAVASLNLAYLVRNGDIYAGQLELKGQTLYVVGGQGDLQIFDVSPWLEGSYNHNIELKNYYSVQGNAEAFAFHPRSLFVGSAFPYIGDTPVENPVSQASSVSQLGGRLNTIVNDLLTITEQVPFSEQILSADQPIELQFNRHLDFNQVTNNGEQLFEVTLDGTKVEGFVSLETTNDGSRLYFQPSSPWQDAKRYRVNISSALKDNQGQALGANYSFRFIAADNLVPSIIDVRPALSNWRGGEVITIVGQNFTVNSTITLGNKLVEQANITSVNNNQLSFTLPALESSPADNLLMGVTVHNGLLHASKRAAFTYIADPQITSIGAYDRVDNIFTPTIHRFVFNGQEIAAISGTGFSSFTKVTINGDIADDVILENANLISFRLPENTLGQLNVSVSNDPEEADLFTNNELSIELAFEPQIASLDQFYRHNDLLLLTEAAPDNKTDWRLTTTAEADLPQTLATGNITGRIIDADISDNYLAFIVNETRRQVLVYDISNVYAPELINQFTNEEGLLLDNINITGDVLIASNGNQLFSAYILGQNIETKVLPDDVRFVNYDEDGVYVLYETHIDFYDITNLATLHTRYEHFIANPVELVIDEQRVLIRSTTEIELINSFTLKHTQANALIGRTSINHNQALLNGELLALRSNNSDVFTIFDIDSYEQSLQLNHLADVRTQYTNNIEFVDFSSDLFEWIESDTPNNTQGTYANITLPFNNIWRISPNILTSESDTLTLSVSGDFSHWEKAVVNVIPESTGVALPGFNQPLGKNVIFDITGANYELGEQYKITLATNPPQSIEGAEVNIDLPLYLSSSDLFGLAPTRLINITPNNSITGRLINYRVTGQQLGAISVLTLGELTLTAEQFDVNSQGTEINFLASSELAGFKTLQALHTDNIVASTLPAAVLLSQSIQVSDIQTNNDLGSDSLSDSGNNKITINGLGLNGDISVHLLPLNGGVSPSQNNKLTHRLSDGSLIIDRSPPVISGQQYQLVLIREATSEVYVDDVFILNGIDDTHPQLIQNVEGESVTLSFNEAITATGFSVIKQFKDYSGNSDLDISNRFELVNLSSSSIALRLRDGEVLNDNANYLFHIEGLQDSSGNVLHKLSANSSSRPLDGVYNASFLAKDTLPPRNISVVRSDGVIVNSAMLLTRGRGYSFKVTAEDNYAALGDLNFIYRLSTAFEAPQTGVIHINRQSFKQDILGNYDYLEIRLSVIDEEGFSASENFRASLRDPIVELANFATNPVEPEESVRATLTYQLTGDTDMVNVTRMGVEQIQNGQSMNVFNHYNAIEGTVFGSFLNPKIKDLLPENAPIAPVEMNSKLLVEYGFGFSKVFEQNYTLFLDRTPPTLNIVSPESGDFIAIGDRTDVLIKAFDKYGIETVEVSKNDGPFVVLDDPSRYSFTANADDIANGVTIAAQATDPNGNVSTVDTVTLYPYDAEDGAPQVDIISPDNGSTFHENQSVTFEVLLRNVTEAELYLDVGGVEADPSTAIAISRTVDGPERQFITATIPEVNEDIVVLARVQRGSLKNFKFLSVLDDQGIEENVILNVQPAAQILSGTKLHVDSTAPVDMVDFDESSLVNIFDPINTPVKNSALIGQPITTDINASGSEVVVESILRDKSGNENIAQHTVSKLHYFTDESSTDYFISAANENIDFIESIAGFAREKELVMGINRLDGGYRIATATKTLFEVNEGQLINLIYTGTGLVAQVKVNGQHQLDFYALENTTFKAAQSQLIYGDVIAASGNTVWIKHGDLISATSVTRTGFVPVAGLSLREPLVAAHTHGNYLFVLTDSGLYQYNVSLEDIPKVNQAYYIAVPDQQGFIVQNNKLLVWSHTEITRYQLLENGGLSAPSNNVTEINGSVITSRLDGNLTWLKVSTEKGLQWQAYLGNELIGLLPEDNMRGDRVFVAQRGYQLLTSNNTDNSSDKVLYRPINIVQESVHATSISTEVLQNVFGITLTVGTDEQSIGANSVTFTNENGQKLSAQSQWVAGKLQWFIDYADLLNTSTINVSVSTHVGTTSKSIAIDVLNNTVLPTISPTDLTQITENALVPVVTRYLESAKINAHILNTYNTQLALAPVMSSAYQWLSLTDTNNNAVNVQVNNNEQENLQFTLVSNVAEQSDVIILSPDNNQRFDEGESVKVAYSSNSLDSDVYRYSQISLFDFNRNLIATVLSGQESGNLNIRLPSVEQLDTFYINVRSYYGEQYRYTEREVGIRIAPTLQVPKPDLLGVTSRVFAGSNAHYSLVNEENGQYETRIEVFDELQQLLVSDASAVNFTVPETAKALRVVATITDSYGNHQEVAHDIVVVPAITPSLIVNDEAFDFILPDVGNAWFVRDRSIFDEEGALQVTLDAKISAITRLTDRLLIALEDNRLVIVDPLEDFQVVSTYVTDTVITELAVLNTHIMAIGNNTLYAFNATGNTLEPVTLQTSSIVNNRVSLRNYEHNESVLGVSATGPLFSVLRSDSLISFSTDFISEANRVHSTPNAISMITHLNTTFVSTENGALYIVNSKAEISTLDLATEIDKLTRYGDYLIALSDGNRASSGVHFIDVTNLAYPELMASYDLPLPESVSTAKLYNGNIYLGDNSATIIELQQPSYDPVVTYSSDKARGFSRDIAIHNGVVSVAAEQLGAQLLTYQNGVWQQRNYPTQAYTIASHVTAIDEQSIYLAQHDRRVVESLNRYAVLSSQLSGDIVFENIVADHIATTPSKLIATTGNQIHLSSKDDFATQGRVELPEGENIIGLVTHGESVFVTTDNRRLYRVNTGPLPLNDFDVSIESIIDGGSDIIENLSTSGDYLFFQVGNSIHKFDLNSFIDTSLELTDSVNISSMAYGNGYVWVADRNASTARIRPVDITTWEILSEFTYELSEQVTSMAINNGLLAIAKGSFGIDIIDLGRFNSASTALLSPSASKVFTQGQSLSLSLVDTANVSAVNYYINGDLATGTDTAPFTLDLLVPANLRNGQPFNVSAEIETISGEVLTVNNREVLLQGENLPANGFDVILVQPQANRVSFVPKPLEIRAEVRNSTQPIYQVEYYESDSINGPFKIIGKHFGPEFVIYREYDVADSGTYIKLRAIDIFGNFTESTPVPFTRVEDNKQPQASTFVIDGPQVIVNGIATNDIFDNHDFSLNIQVSDPESGIESAILRRNGIIVAAIFEDGLLNFKETTAQIDDVLTYELTLRDNAGNTHVVSETYTIVEDLAPEITSFTITSDPIYEQGIFSVNYEVTDEVAIERIELQWNGFTTSVNANHVKNFATSVDLRDTRAERISANISQPLTLRVIDDIGQVTEQDVMVTLQPNQAPDASKLSVNYQANSIYGNNMEIRVNDLNNANDDRENIRVDIIEISTSSERIINTDSVTARATYNSTIRLPSTDIPNNEYKFKVRITDYLGQVSETDVLTVSLTSLPNEVRFYKEANQTHYNPSVVNVDESPIYQIEVIDQANRRVPNQNITWRLISVATVGEANDIILSTSTSDINGLASLNLNTEQITGVYNLRAELSANANVLIERRIRIDTGETSELRFDFIQDIEAGEVFTVNVTARDDGGNIVTGDSITNFSFELPYQGFNFGFANNVNVTPLPTGGERAIISLTNGRANFPISAITESGIYSAVANVIDNTDIDVTYTPSLGATSQKTEQLTLTVIHTNPFQIRLEEKSKTNHPYGELLRLEETEEVTLTATLLDRFYNRVYTLNPLQNAQDADFVISLATTGDATLSADNLSLTQGYGEFTVTNETVETINVTTHFVSEDNSDLALDTLQTFVPIELSFEKLKPAIINNQFIPGVNNYISPLALHYSEAINDPDASVVAITLDDVAVDGNFELLPIIDTSTTTETTQVVFTPENMFELGRCYSINTAGSSLRGTAANDAVLAQSLSACAPQVYIEVPQHLYLLEGTTTSLNLLLDGQLDSNLLSGNAVVSRVENRNFNTLFDTQLFAVNDPQFNITLPTHTGTGLPDGQEVVVQISVANVNEQPELVAGEGVSNLEEAEPVNDFDTSNQQLKAGNNILFTILQVNGDFDGDGLPNGLELTLPGYDPTHIDSDGNGVNDGDEDIDADGLSNSQEVQANTQLLNGDSDNDGVSDFDEVVIHQTDLMAFLILLKLHQSLIQPTIKKHL